MRRSPRMPPYGAEEVQMLVEEAIGIRLTDHDRQLLGHRLGWGGHPVLSQADVARKLGTHQPTISQQEMSLKLRLRRVARRRSKDREALEAQQATLVEMYRLMAATAEQLGTDMPKIAAMAFPPKQGTRVKSRLTNVKRAG
jgi:hypothetical protein